MTAQPKHTTDELVADIRAFAQDNLQDMAWDTVYHTYDDSQIAEVLGKVSTWKAALAKFAPVVAALAVRAAEQLAAQQDSPGNVDHCPACGYAFPRPQPIREGESACKSAKMCARRQAALAA